MGVEATTPNRQETTAATTAEPAKIEPTQAVTAEPPAPERLPVEEVRVSMARVITAWGFGASFFNLTAGAIYTSFARGLGANDFIFGVLAAIAPLMSFLQVLSARLVEVAGRRKLQMMIAGIIGRSFWVVAALLGLMTALFPHLLSKRQALPLVIGCILIAGAFQAFTSTAFFSWMADLVPAQVRPAFFARRMQVGTCVAMVTALAGGWIADTYPHLWVYSAVLALAGIAGVLDTALFMGVREPVPSSTVASTDEAAAESDVKLSLFAGLADSMREPWHDPAVRRFLRFVSLLWLGYGLQGAFLWLHLLEYLHLSKTQTGLVLNVAPLFGILCTSRFWAAMIKRYGNRPVMRLCSAGLVLVPLGHLTAQPVSAGAFASWGMLMVMTFYSGSLACALELTNLNLMTSLAPHIPRSTMTAIYMICVGLSMAAASWGGGALAQWLSGIEYEFAGHTFINYHVLFLCALLVRLINAAFFSYRLYEPGSTNTIEAIRDVAPEIAQSLSARVTWPFGVLPGIARSVATHIPLPFPTRAEEPDEDGEGVTG
ncbi:MAG: MFS transporter [Armatimonadota bacterium]|nr:MFS transporter [Armatimonadota bacterium]